MTPTGGTAGSTTIARFVIHYADLASLTGSQALVIGGDWIAPALPAGDFADGTPSGVPADAEARWKSLIAEVRQHFRGTVIFALPYDIGVISAPIGILSDADVIYLLWFAKLSDQANPEQVRYSTKQGACSTTMSHPSRCR